MNKFYGKIGFATNVETSPGIWEDQIVERPYYGDVVKNARKFSQTDSQSGTLTITNEFSILADAYANENFHAIRYVEWMGIKWTATTIDATQRPRLIINVGGIYDGE